MPASRYILNVHRTALKGHEKPGITRIVGHKQPIKRYYVAVQCGWAPELRVSAMAQQDSNNKLPLASGQRAGRQ